MAKRVFASSSAASHQYNERGRLVAITASNAIEVSARSPPERGLWFSRFQRQKRITHPLPLFSAFLIVFHFEAIILQTFLPEVKLKNAKMFLISRNATDDCF